MADRSPAEGAAKKKANGGARRGENPIDQISEDQKMDFLILFGRFVAAEKLDKNKQLSPEDIEYIKGRKISARDLERLCKTHGYGHTASDPIKEQDVKFMMSTVDMDGEGEIDFDEFLTLMAKHLNEDELVEDVVKAFQVLNVKVEAGESLEENMRCISAAELKYFMTNFGEKLTDEEVDELFNEADITYEKEVDILEFVRATLLK